MWLLLTAYSEMEKKNKLKAEFAIKTEAEWKDLENLQLDYIKNEK